MIASVTRIKLKNPLKLFKFFLVVPKVMKQAGISEGNMSYAARYKGYLTFWTLTSWESKEAMMAFVLNGVHKEVMKETRWYSSDFETTNWVTTGKPSWDEAEKALFSKKTK
ncbi:MAG: DUF3291 domain-containing protein [Ignavibacteriae bacterium]|nr:DUF3291 domain-containing protein [Ignavibacteriota bacterium]